ncbi:MAG TPA: UPF0182 family protein [Acidimicrobiia bacterium]|nr:UPF0182 family protein [Acidimicrobiia bacterium]
MINRDPVPLRPRSRSRRLLSILAVGLIILLFTLRSIATFWTDYLWFDSLDLTGVWSTLVFTKVWLVVAATVFAAVLIWLNLWLAGRLSPTTPAPPGSPDEELLERWQQWVRPRQNLVRIGAALGLGLLLGLGASLWWQDFLLFRFGGDFGVVDPIFENDVGLYVFRLPFYRALFGWMFQLFIVLALVVAVIHYLNGGIQVQQDSRRVSPGVKVHLSVILALLALLKAVGYWLDTWDLLYSERGQVTGASYTDVNAQLPALRLLILISIVAAVILLVNLWFRGWTLPLVAVGLWLFTSIVVGGLYPAFIQRFRVVPEEVNREVEFVQHNIEFTRYAFGLDSVEVRDFAASSELESSDLAENQATIDNIRLWDPSVLRTTYRELQEIRTFYGIEDVDVDRYLIDGELTQVMVSARELDPNNIPGGGWVNEKLIYTHGFGAVLSPANDVTTAGQPDFIIQDIPPVSTDDALEIEQPRIYFSDNADEDYLIVNTNEQEVDFPVGNSDVARNSYDGSGGVVLGNALRQAAWALRFGDVDVLISGEPREDSRVLLERNIRDRVERVAPFLFADADPYLVLINGELKWVLDLYTVSSNFPYSDGALTGRLDRTRGLPLSFNYIRNPVKATVDAFTGEMTFYVIDDSDPLIRAQRKIFPELFTDQEMPDELRDHLRYPEDLFRVQSDMYLLYHMTNAREFFNVVDPWQIASDPSTSQRTELRGLFIDDEGNQLRPMLPYYLLMKLPEEDELSFLIMQPFTPENRPNMTSFLTAKSGPAAYGQIIDYRLPSQSAQQGPGQVGNFINQDPAISAEFTLLGQGGSEVIQGNMLVVPVEESLLYVQPIYIRADPEGSSDSSGIPEFKRVVVSFDGRIEMADTLDQALAAIFGEAQPGLPAPGEEPSDGAGQDAAVPEEVAALLTAAADALEQADAALRSGDLGAYQESVERAQDFIARAQALAGDAPAEDATEG